MVYHAKARGFRLVQAECALRPVWGVMFLLYCSRARVLKVQRVAYKLVKQCRTSRSPTLSYVGGFPFYSSSWCPHYRYLALCLGTVGVRFVLVSRRGPLGRSGVGRLDPGDLLGQPGKGRSWRSSLATHSLGAVPSWLSRGGVTTQVVARGSPPVLSVGAYVPCLRGHLA